MRTIKPCNLVVVQPDGRRLTGTAAQLAHISRAGGWDSFLQQVAEATLQNFAANYNRMAKVPSLVVVGSRPLHTEG